MTNKNLEFKVTVNENDAVKSLDSVDKSVSTLNDNLETLESTTEVAFSDMGESIEGVSNEYNDLIKSTNKAAKSQNDLNKSSSGATKGLKVLGKGAKAIGGAFKAMGIGVIIGLFVSLWDALKKNQKVMDAVSVVMNTVSVVFNKVVTVLSDAWENLTKNNEAFTAMKTVVTNVIKLALTPFRLAFLAIKAAVLGAQLIWEKSIFGGKDQNKIDELTAKLDKTKEQIIKLGKDTVESGKAIAQNISAAAEGVVQFAKDSINGIKEISIQASVEQAKTIANAEKNFERLELLQQRLMITSIENAELQRQIRDDETKSIDERIEANEELGRILDEQAQSELDLINQRLEGAKLNLSLNEDSVELQNQVLSLENEALDLQERITGQRSEQLVNRNALEKEAIEKRLEEEQHAADILSQIYQKSAEEQLEIEKERLILEVENLLISEEEKKEALLELEENYQIALGELNEERIDKEAKAEDEFTKKKDNDRKEELEKKKKAVNDFLSATSNISSKITKLNNDRIDNELSKLNAKEERAFKNFRGTEQEKAKLEKEFAKKRADLEYKKAKANQNQAAIDAAIATSVEVTKTLSNPFLAAAIGVLGAAEVLMIKGKKIEKPSYGKGGVLNGPSHANGGIITPFGELEGGEGIINNVSMNNSDLKNLASAANEAGGGVAFGDGKGINLSPETVAAIISGINNKQVVLNTNELSNANDEVTLIENESQL